MRDEKEIQREIDSAHEDYKEKIDRLNAELVKARGGIEVGTTLVHKACDWEFKITSLDHDDEGFLVGARGALFMRNTDIPDDDLDHWEVKK